MEREHSREYTRYLRSKRWLRKRREVLEIAGWECQGCGVPHDEEPLEVHHLTYDHLGHEPLEDLAVVCHVCHEAEDRARAARVAEAQWERRVHAWGDKVYGDYWDEEHSWAEVEDRFRAWLEAKGLE